VSVNTHTPCPVPAGARAGRAFVMDENLHRLVQIPTACIGAETVYGQDGQLEMSG